MSLDNEGFQKKQKQIPPAEQHVAVCYGIIDLGKQKEQFENKPAQFVNKVQFCWEFPILPKVVFDEKKGEQPMAIFQEYTVAAGDRAKLPKMLCSWGRMPKIEKLTSALLKMFLGQACMIQVEHAASKKDNDAETGRPLIFANVGQKGLAVLPFATNLGLVKPTGIINKPIFFNLDHFTWESYLALPEYTQKKIAESQDWSGILVKHPRPADAVNTAAANNAAPATHTPANTLGDAHNGISEPTGRPAF